MSKENDGSPFSFLSEAAFTDTKGYVATLLSELRQPNCSGCWHAFVKIQENGSVKMKQIGSISNLSLWVNTNKPFSIASSESLLLPRVH